MKYSLAILIIFALSCSSPEKKSSLVLKDPEWVEKLIKENDCVQEYNYAKLIVNIFSYKETCVSVFCPPYNYDQKVKVERMNQFRIQLDTSKVKGGLVENGDTLEFCFKMINKDSCFCTDRLDHYPSRIALIRGTQKIVTIGDGYITTWPLKEDIEKWFNDPSMLSYVKQNKDSIDPWFYNELQKLGYLK